MSRGGTLRHYTPPVGKRVHVFKSGDPTFRGARVTVNPLHVRNVDMMIDEVTEKVTYVWGGIRSIHTPHTGTRVESLEDVVPNGTYVAAGPGGFAPIPGGYERLGKARERRAPPLLLLRKNRTSPHYEAAIHVYRNGAPEVPPTRLTLTRRDLLRWADALSAIAYEMRLHGTTIEKLFTASGKPIKTVRSIRNGGVYVAVVQDEAFQPTFYDENLSGSSSARSSTEETTSARDDYVERRIPAFFASYPSTARGLHTIDEAEWELEEAVANFEDRVSVGEATGDEGLPFTYTVDEDGPETADTWEHDHYAEDADEEYYEVPNEQHPSYNGVDASDQMDTQRMMNDKQYHVLNSNNTEEYRETDDVEYEAGSQVQDVNDAAEEGGTMSISEHGDDNDEEDTENAVDVERLLDEEENQYHKEEFQKEESQDAEEGFRNKEDDQDLEEIFQDKEHGQNAEIGLQDDEGSQDHEELFHDEEDNDEAGESNQYEDNKDYEEGKYYEELSKETDAAVPHNIEYDQGVPDYEAVEEDSQVYEEKPVPSNGEDASEADLEVIEEYEGDTEQDYEAGVTVMEGGVEINQEQTINKEETSYDEENFEVTQTVLDDEEKGMKDIYSKSKLPVQGHLQSGSFQEQEELEGNLQNLILTPTETKNSLQQQISSVSGKSLRKKKLKNTDREKTSVASPQPFSVSPGYRGIMTKSDTGQYTIAILQDNPPYAPSRSGSRFTRGPRPPKRARNLPAEDDLASRIRSQVLTLREPQVTSVPSTSGTSGQGLLSSAASLRPRASSAPETGKRVAWDTDTLGTGSTLGLGHAHPDHLTRNDEFMEFRFDNETKSPFYAQSKSRPLSRTVEVDYDTDEGGLFRAHSASPYTQEADDVLESSQTHVEIPVDLREAEEVAEEVVG